MDKPYNPDTIYEEVEKGEKVDCIYDQCTGHLKKSRKFKEFFPDKFSKKYSGTINSGKSLICRCSKSCRHKLVILKNEFYQKSVIIKL